LRKLRKILALGSTLLGTVLVFLAILVPAISQHLQLQVLVVLVGVLIIEAGVWRLTSAVLPEERKYAALRTEVNAFVERVRLLNAHGVKLQTRDDEVTREDFRETLNALHAAVDRIAEVAGREL
jgi:hypothetical protein